MTMDLDTQLRVASDSLRRASRGLTPTGPRPTGRPPLAVAGMVVVVVLLLAAAGGAVLRLTHDDRSADDRHRVSTEDLPDIPRLMPGAYPDGLPDPIGLELPAPSVFGTDRASMTVYGEPGADDPFAAGDLAVIVSDSDVRPYMEGSGDQTTVTVRGTEGLSTEATEDSPVGRSITWQDTDGRHILVASHSLDEAQLLAVAEALTIAGDDLVLATSPRGVPAMEQVSAANDYLVSTLLIDGAPVRQSSEGSMVGNETDDYDKGFFVVTSAGNASDLELIRWLTRVDTPTEVRGHPAWARTDDHDQTLVWEESPGVIVVVLANGITDAELQTAVDSLRPASDVEWDQLPHSPFGDPTGDAVDDVVGGEDAAADEAPFLQGTYSAGMWGVFYNAVVPEVCATLLPEAGDDAPNVCVGAYEPASVLTDRDGVPVLLFGIMPEGAERIGDPTLSATAQTTNAPDGQVLYAITLDDQPAPTEVTFVDTEGQMVTTRDVATPALGN